MPTKKLNTPIKFEHEGISGIVDKYLPRDKLYQGRLLGDGHCLEFYSRDIEGLRDAFLCAITTEAKMKKYVEDQNNILIEKIRTGQLEYKGYYAQILFSPFDRVFHGKVLGITDLVSFESDELYEIDIAFHSAVDDYLETCKEIGKSPEAEA